MDFIELTIAEAEALKQGIEFGRKTKRALATEVQLMREELGLERFDQTPEDQPYLRALEKLLEAGVTDPGATLGDIDKEKRFG